MGQDHWHAAAVLGVFPVQANQVALLELNCDQTVRGSSDCEDQTRRASSG